MEPDSKVWSESHWVTWHVVRVKTGTVMRWYLQDDKVNQEESQQDTVDGMKEETTVW